jgi:putative sterol carrier protein
MFALIYNQLTTSFKEDAAMPNEMLARFLALCTEDDALKTFAKNRKMSAYFRITDSGDQFYIAFDAGTVKADAGAPATTADLVLSMSSQTLQGLMTGKLHGETAVMSGQLYVSDEWRAMDMQAIQRDLARLFQQASS